MFAPESDGIVDSLIEAEYKAAIDQWGETYKDDAEAHDVVKKIVGHVPLDEATKYFGRDEDGVPRDVKKLSPNPECAAFNIKNARAAIKELAQVCAVCGKILHGESSAV